MTSVHLARRVNETVLYLTKRGMRLCFNFATRQLTICLRKCFKVQRASCPARAQGRALQSVLGCLTWWVSWLICLLRPALAQGFLSLSAASPTHVCAPEPYCSPQPNSRFPFCTVLWTAAGNWFLSTLRPWCWIGGLGGTHMSLSTSRLGFPVIIFCLSVRREKELHSSVASACTASYSAGAPKTCHAEPRLAELAFIDRTMQPHRWPYKGFLAEENKIL